MSLIIEVLIQGVITQKHVLHFRVCPNLRGSTVHAIIDPSYKSWSCVIDLLASEDCATILQFIIVLPVLPCSDQDASQATLLGSAYITHHIVSYHHSLDIKTPNRYNCHDLLILYCRLHYYLCKVGYPYIQVTTRLFKPSSMLPTIYIIQSMTNAEEGEKVGEEEGKNEELISEQGN